MTFVFKDIKKHADFDLVYTALQDTKLVDSFVMQRAQKGLFEYEVVYFGDKEAVIDAVTQATTDKLNIKTKEVGKNVEVTFNPS